MKDNAVTGSPKALSISTGKLQYVLRNLRSPTSVSKKYLLPESHDFGN